ncbi:MAG: hypothetical protein C5B50_01085 [Verrucomicrobia bacterium]|nr:MAG: hypothetical protein C5B50_01085 [Verrucomicrobiota bacterium]
MGYLRQSNSIVKMAAITLPFLLSAGCAVLTVDVDVYKGALANQQEIQTKQLAAMTMAAKPILEGLSNRLRLSITQELKASKTNLDHISLHANVADILGLYEDVGVNTNSAPVVAIVTALRETHRDFTNSAAAFTTNRNLTNEVSTNWLAYKQIASSLLNYSSQLPKPAVEAIKSLPENASDLQEATTAALAVQTSTAQVGSLQGGRLDDGIETIIRRYLNRAAAIYDTSKDPDAKLYRRQLWISCVDFAEKVKFIADNQSSATLQPGYSRYIIALQAIGNSILSLADALQERFTFQNNVLDTTNGFSALSAATNYLAHSSASARTFPVPGATNNPPAQLSLLIDELKDIQIAATLEGQTNLASHAQAAIALATAYHADSIYILPTMAYLRSSYPATTLQKNDDGLWHNMLADQSWRSLPAPFGGWVANAHINGDDARAQAETDKQFWQTINQIRVAGSGITSYVLTKDDIGNWYIKSYTADPTPIIEGAKSLALTTAGPTALASPKGVSLPVKSPATNAEPALLAKELGIITDAYAVQTLQDGTNLVLTTTNLIGDLRVQLGQARPLSFTNVFTNSVFLFWTNPVPLTFSNAFTGGTFQHDFTNTASSTTGLQFSDLLSNATSYSSNDLANSMSNTSQETNISRTLTNNSLRGFGVMFSKPGTVVSSNRFLLSLPETSSTPVLTATNSVRFTIVTSPQAQGASPFTTNLVLGFTNFSTSILTNYVSIPILSSNLGTAESVVGASNHYTALVYDFATNSVTVVHVWTNGFIHLLTNTFTSSIANTSPGTYTNTLQWTLTNTSAINFGFFPSNSPALWLFLTNFFNSTNATTIEPSGDINLDFLQTSYDRYVRSPATNLATKIFSPHATTNALAIADYELALLQQWDEVINKVALSGTPDQKRIVVQYVAPQIRALARRRLDAMKAYTDGLKLLAQSQQ